MRPCCEECHGIGGHWPGCPNEPEETNDYDPGHQADLDYDRWRDDGR